MPALLPLLQLAVVLTGCLALLASARAALLARPRLDLPLWHLTQHWPQPNLLAQDHLWLGYSARLAGQALSQAGL